MPEAIPRCGPSCKTRDAYTYTTRVDLPRSDVEDPACDLTFAMKLKSHGKSSMEVRAYFALADQVRNDLLPEIGDECRKETGSEECGVMGIRLHESPLDIDLEEHYNAFGSPLKIDHDFVLKPGEIGIRANAVAEVTCGKRGPESLTGAHLSGTVAIARECEEPTQEECVILEEVARLE